MGRAPEAEIDDRASSAPFQVSPPVRLPGQGLREEAGPGVGQAAGPQVIEEVRMVQGQAGPQAPLGPDDKAPLAHAATEDVPAIRGDDIRSGLGREELAAGGL